MSRPAELEKYPPQYFRLAETFEETPEHVIHFPVPDGMEPQTLQLELNTFRKLLEKRGDAFPNFYRAEIGKGLDKRSVYVARKDKTPTAQVVQKGLDNLKGSP